MMLPICVGLLELIKEMFAANGRDIDLNNYKYATGLMLMTAYSCSIGGVLTPIGTPPNTIMLSFLHDMAKVNISFFEWMTWGFIAMALYFVLAYIVISRFFHADVNEIEGAKEYISAKQKLFEYSVKQDDFSKNYPENLPNRIIKSRDVYLYKTLKKIRYINIKDIIGSNGYLNINEINIKEKDKNIPIAKPVIIIGLRQRRDAETAEERFNMLARGWLAYPVTPTHHPSTAEERL